MDVRERYALARSLAETPGKASAKRLIALLHDEESYFLDDGVALFDRDPTEVFVWEAARDSLASMVQVAWPDIVEELERIRVRSAGLDVAPPDDDRAARRLLGILEALSPEQRSALPWSAHQSIVGVIAELGLREFAETAAWESDHAGGDPAQEAFWRTRLGEHPDSLEREHALLQLTQVAADKAGLVQELVQQLEGGAGGTIVRAMDRLPLSPEVVRRLASSDLPRKHSALVKVLAKYGADAAALVPLCLEMLQHEKIGDYVPWMPQGSLDDRRWRLASESLVLLGDAAASAREALVERLLATNEQASLLGSLRSRLLDALGDPARLLAEIEPRLDQLEASADVVEANRGRQIRQHLESRIGRRA